MSKIEPSSEDFLRLFREEIDEHLHWQEAQGYYGLLTLEPGWKRPAGMVFDELHKVEVKIPSARFRKALEDFFWNYVY